jgi:AmiR/NasT family two-component response regulator
MNGLPEPDASVERFAFGTTDEATTAIARLLAVTEATLERRAQLEHALRSRVAIEQAKGILAERYGLDVEQAFNLLRNAARTNRMKLHELVARVRPNEETPPEVVAVLEANRRV